MQISVIEHVSNMCFCSDVNCLEFARHVTVFAVTEVVAALFLVGVAGYVSCEWIVVTSGT